MPRDARSSPSRLLTDTHRFGPSDRVLRSSDFERIYREGRRLTSPSFALFVLPNEAGRSRLGMTVTRQFGCAVLRNRHKRIVREIFRRNRDAFDSTKDYVVNIRSGAQRRSFRSLETEMLRVVRGAARGERS